MPTTSYVIALGSNRRHGRHGDPARILNAAVRRLREEGMTILLVSPVLRTPALGPAGRAFANAAALVETDLNPVALLRTLKRLEAEFGRRRGRRWGPRVLDLDIILWSEGGCRAEGLVIPHPQFRRRLFVLAPVLAVAEGWRDPFSGRSMRQLHARLRRRRPVDPNRSGQ